MVCVVDDRKGLSRENDGFFCVRRQGSDETRVRRQERATCPESSQ